MCLAQQRSSATTVGGSGSSHGGIGTLPAAAGETTRNRARRWRHMIWNYGKQSVHLIQSRQKWREIMLNRKRTINLIIHAKHVILSLRRIQPNI